MTAKINSQENPLSLLYLIAFTAQSSIQVVMPLTSLFAMYYLNTSIAEAGYIVSAFYLGSMILKLPLVFSRGEQKTPYLLLTSCIILSVSPVLCALSFSPFILFIVRFIYGTGFSLLAASALSLATLMSLKGSRGKAINRYTGTLAFGLMAGPGISSILLIFLDIKETLVTASAIVFPSVLCALIIMKRATFHLNDISQEKSRLRSQIAEVFKNKSFQISFLSYFSYSLVYGTLLSYVPIYLKGSIFYPHI